MRYVQRVKGSWPDHFLRTITLFCNGSAFLYISTTFKGLTDLWILIMGTITISIDDATEKKFREVASRRIGDRKGSLGKATTEALELWIRTQTQEEIAQEGLHLLRQGYDLGKRKYRTRDDLYERRTGTC
jgi:hypothetical protein